MKTRINIIYKHFEVNKGSDFVELVDQGRGKRRYTFK